MAKAKARIKTGPKLRFEVFKRDSFTCQYCGNTPPAVILEIDHILPVCNGGETTEENLVTACYDCNRGKAGNSLSDIPESLQSRAERMEEAESQMKAYSRLLAAKKRRTDQCVKRLEAVFSEAFDGDSFTPRFRHDIRASFAPKLMPEELEEAMEYACSRIYEPDRALRYFCGICWNKIRKGEDG